MGKPRFGIKSILLLTLFVALVTPYVLNSFRVKKQIERLPTAYAGLAFQLEKKLASIDPDILVWGSFGFSGESGRISEEQDLRICSEADQSLLFKRILEFVKDELLDDEWRVERSIGGSNHHLIKVSNEDTTYMVYVSRYAISAEEIEENGEGFRVHLLFDGFFTPSL